MDRYGSQRHQSRPVLTRSDLEVPPAGILVHRYPQYADVVHYRQPDQSEALPAAVAGDAGTTESMLPFVIELHHARILGRHAAVLTQQGQIVLESVGSLPNYVRQTSFSRIHFPTSFADLRQQIGTAAQLDTVASIINLFSAGFFHWMIECLPRLHSLSLYESQTGIRPRLLIDPNPTPYMLESLAMLGYQPQDYQPWNQTRGQASTMLIPWMANLSGHPSPTACRWVSQRMQHNRQRRTFSTPYIYLSRADAALRRVVNEDELIHALEPLGFVPYQLSRMPLSDQIDLFAQAKIVIGAHGAGFANLIHSQNAQMIEFFEPGYLNACFFRLASALGHGYRALITASVGNNMRVEIDRVLALLAHS
jgi:hypothetical protein